MKPTASRPNQNEQPNNSMSMDLDLYAVTYRDGCEKSSRQQREAFTKILDVVGLDPFTPADSIPHVKVKLHVADWKHAYNIWQWFSNHVQGGESSEAETPVDLETLQSLHDVCKKLLVRRNRKEAAAALPLPDNLFRGKAEENEYWRESYWPDVELTVEQLGPLLANPKFMADWEFSYEVS
jgi:hypothetical protein